MICSATAAPLKKIGVAKLSKYWGRIDETFWNCSHAYVSDGSKLVYLWWKKDGTLTADSVKEDNAESVEQAKVDLYLDGTEPQLFVFDTTVKDGKALQLTTKMGNKSFVTLLHSGHVDVGFLPVRYG